MKKIISLLTAPILFLTLSAWVTPAQAKTETMPVMERVKEHKVDTSKRVLRAVTSADVIIQQTRYITTLKFESKLLDHIHAGISEADWGKLFMIANLQNEDGEIVKLECEFDAAGISYPAGGDFGTVNTQNTNFKFNFDIFDERTQCSSSLTEDEYKAIAQVSNIVDIRIGISDGLDSLGIDTMDITAEYDDSTTVKFYRGRPNVWIEGLAAASNYPKVGASCGAEAANGGFDSPDAASWIDPTNDLIKLPSTKVAVFSQGDKQVHMIVNLQPADLFSASVDPLKWAFEDPSLGTDCSDEDRQYSLFNSGMAQFLLNFAGLPPSPPRKIEYEAMFYVNDAVTDEEIDDGGTFYKLDTGECFNDDLRIDSVYISVWQSWENDDGRRHHWEINSETDFILADACLDNTGSAYDGSQSFEFTKTNEKWSE